MKSKYTGISNGVLYDLQNVNFETMNGLCDIEGYNRPQWCLFEEILPSNSMHIRLMRAGVKIINNKKGSFKDVILEYNEKQIFRPNTIDCVNVVKQSFGINI